MTFTIYSIYDNASGLYSRPFFNNSDAEALRNFSDLANDKEHPVGSHPEDYSLFSIGEWNDVHGKLQNDDNTCLATANEVLIRNQPDAFEMNPNTSAEPL